MKNFICINGKKTELTEEQMRQLGIEPEKKNPFDEAGNGEKYYYIGTFGNIEFGLEQISRFDDYHYAVANYCTDKSLMEQRALHETLNRLLWRYSMEHGGDEIEWDDGIRSKYVVYYNAPTRRFDISSFHICKLDTTYFSTYETAEAAIEEIIKPFMAKHPEFIW